MWWVVALALAQAPDAGSLSAAGGEGDADAGVARETVVVGTPETKTAGSTHTINGARLKRFELDNPEAVLQAVPGVQARGEDGFGLRPNIGIRGTNPDRSKKVTLLEDGVLFGPAPYSAPAAYYFPLVTRMEAVRVVKGPAAILYGPQTVAGAVDFITRDLGPGMNAGLDLALGQYWYGKGHGFFSVGNDTTAFLLEGVHLRSDGFKELDLVGGNTGFQRNEWMMKFRHRATLAGLPNTFTLKLGFSAEESNETYLGLTDADFRENALRRYVTSQLDHMSSQRTQVTLTHKLEAPGFTLTTVAYRHDLHRTWRKLNHFGGTTIDQVLANPNSARNRLYLGVLRGELDTSSPNEALFIGPNERDFVSQGIETVLRTSFTTGPISHETHAVALSVSDAMQWGPVTLTPGVRVELINSSSTDRLARSFTPAATNVVLPGIGAHVAVTDNIGLLAGIYRGFSPPPPGLPNGQPELAMNVEGGARWTRGGERVELIGFFNDYANINDNLDTQFNAGRARLFGLEAFAEKRWRFGQVTLPTSIAYTLTGSQLLESFRSDDPVLGDVQAGDELAYVPRHLLNVSAGIDWWRLSAHAQFSFVDRMREKAGQGAFDPAWTTDVQAVLDVHLAFALSSWAQLTFDARNLTDNRALVGRRPFGARPNAPRMLIGGLKLNW